MLCNTQPGRNTRRSPGGAVFVFALLLAAACFAQSSVKFEKQNITILRADGAEVPLRVELAESREQHARGFMERKEIPPGTGMLFVFDRDQVLSFWMKNTPTPLSIAYIDSRSVIREIHDMKPLSEKPVTSATSLRYALEVPRGWFGSQGIQPGDTLKR